MKISGLRSHLVLLPADEPLAGFPDNPRGTRPIVTLEVETDDGVVGVGVTYFGGALSRTLKHAVDELGAQALGEDPLRVEAVAAKLRAAAGSAGPGGVAASLRPPRRAAGPRPGPASPTHRRRVSECD
ncbi:MAG: hypothetical protein ACREE1_09185 [Stellaceae bacterium]